MSRFENRSREMEVFVDVVNSGGFTAAAQINRLTPSAISKLISRLEKRLGARLFNRSTRVLQVTSEGADFYSRCVKILSDMADAEQSLGGNDIPFGELRVNMSTPVGMRCILPLIPRFQQQYPQISLNMTLNDRVVDLLELNTEIAIRSGPLKDSGLQARRLGSTQMLLVASPDYLLQRGTPRNISDLSNHNRIGFSFARTIDGWPLNDEGQQRHLATDGNIHVSDGEALRLLACAGTGIARLAEFMVRDDIKNGALVPLLPKLHIDDREDIHIVYIGQGGRLPLRVRAFIDFFVENIDI